MTRSRPGNLVRSVLVMALAFFARNGRTQTTGYDQPYRPQVHFSPREHWTNDPNGLVFFRGEYHLFFQYNPFGDQWGHMSWGHAVSKDMLHWKELPVAIPEKDGVMIFTGSIVIDQHNTSGLCAPKSECMVAIYTGSGDTLQGPRQTQNIAYSHDNGRTWIAYDRNPVLDLHLADFRDPSVFWDDKQHQWVMAVSLPKEHIVRFYSSRNLKEWTKLSDFGPAGDVAGDWECPDLLHVPDSNGKDGGVWALKVGLNPGAPQGGSGEQYFLGSFDGKRFAQSNEPGSHGWTNYGKDDYCAISFNHLPKNQNPVLLGWMSNWQYAAKLPTSPWRGQMSLARRLSLVRDGAGLALKQEPIVTALRLTSIPISAALDSSKEIDNILKQITPYELELEFGGNSGSVSGLRIYSDDQHWTEIGFDTQHAEFYVDRSNSGLAVTAEFPTKTTAPLIAGRPYDLRLIVDRSSVEAYAQNGTIAMTNLIYPPSQSNKIEFFQRDGKSVMVKGRLWKLHSIWNR
ncbi:MAG TPA: glycoside hydrolase family 32 protein [Candidatus Sulfotelmatobacter sp.]|jgi:fructan beta-fructosidase